MSNRLAGETSPYLLQHAENPVDWYPWGAEAFERARAEDMPIFLSVGYSACHWCHVMEHESFDDPATALLLNTNYVPVKVDREERPDVDAVYMDAVHAVAGRGGWPMSVFLTPEGEPFYAGTYFPKDGRQGMPSFKEVLDRIASLWDTQRSEVLEAAARLTADMRRARDALSSGGGALPGAETLHEAAMRIAHEFDEDDGGWGGPPKFPQAMTIEFLLRRYRQNDDGALMRMASETLDAMARGGIHDHLGGGFHRYATDLYWQVPHFEKMLTDNAMLADVYLTAWELTGRGDYRSVAIGTLDYLLREMADPAGGFYSAQDADTEGEEGRFFVWTPDEITAVLEGTPETGEDGTALFLDAYGVTAEGNFEGGRTVLHMPASTAEIAGRTGIGADELEVRLAAMRARLFEAREKRVRPARDDKVLGGWNGLALGALAHAARAFDHEGYRSAAERCGEFLLAEMLTPEGRMYRSWRDGRATLNGYLEDYANVADGMLELFETTGDDRWALAAAGLADAIIEHFSDPAGGFFDTSDDHEQLIIRPKVVQDGAVPSGGSMAASVLLRLARGSGEARYGEAALGALRSVGPVLGRAPLGFAKWLTVLADATEASGR
jgi:uncharacterized protein YyaL (SSP411 family)